MPVILLIESQEELEPRRQLFLKTLQDNGFEIEVLFWNRSGKIPAEGRLGDIHFRSVNIRTKYSNVRSIFKTPRVYVEYFRSIMGMDFDILVCGHFFLLPLAVFIGKLRGVKVVYDVMEYYIHDFFSRCHPFIRKGEKSIYLLENLLVRCCDGVVTISTYKNMYYDRYHRYNDNVQVIGNVPAYGNRNGAGRHETSSRLRPSDREIILYTGTMSEEWGVGKLLECLKSVASQYPRIKLRLLGKTIGRYDEFIANFVQRENLQANVELVGFVHYSKLFEYLCAADVAVVPIQPVEKFRHVGKGTSRKIFEYMSAGLPIVASDFGEISLVVREEQCGILVDCSDPLKMSTAIIGLLKDKDMARQMGERGRRAVEERYNWEIESVKLLSVYSGLSGAKTC